MKRRRSQSTTENPFVKPENQKWQISTPVSLGRPISPPPSSRHKLTTTKSATAAVEAGEVSVEDHVGFFSAKLLAARRPVECGTPRLDHGDWLALYGRNLNDRGHHFVVHQHDHPVAGTHYDLRLQCNASSSISFAIMYGLPGDPNSRRPNRNGTETRVHNLWNHLIETASHDTGTMLLWDTGEYEVLSHDEDKIAIETDNECSISDSSSTKIESTAHSEPFKLHQAFQRRKIKLRLHGTRLPQGYTLYLRLTKDNNHTEQPKPPSHRRRRKPLGPKQRSDPNTSDSEDANPQPPTLRRSISSLQRTASPPINDPDNTVAMDSEDDNDENIRLSNAYPGATNSINSIHQRKWYLSLDRAASGFMPSSSKTCGHRRWTRNPNTALESEWGGFEKFHVLGCDQERSVVTGRLAKDILMDEGVQGYVPRGMWRAVTE